MDSCIHIHVQLVQMVHQLWMPAGTALPAAAALEGGGGARGGDGALVLAGAEKPVHLLANEFLAELGRREMPFEMFAAECILELSVPFSSFL